MAEGSDVADLAGFLGVDAGTSGMKAVVVDEGGRLIASGWDPYPTHHAPDGGVTQRPSDWVAALRSGVLEVVSAAVAQGVRIRSASVTAPAHNVVALTATGEPHPDVMLWSDPRPAKVVEAIRAVAADWLRDRTLVDLDTCWTLPQLVWQARHQPDRWQAAHHYLPAKDYLRHVLTGDRATDPSDAQGTALFDARRGRWDQEVLERFGLPATRFPEVRSSVTSGGALRPEVAAELGLDRDVVVATGATDTATELVALGADSVGDSLVKIASTGTVVTVADAPVLAHGVLVYPHAVEGLWYVMAAMNNAGTALMWLRELVGAGLSPGDLDELAMRVPRGAEGLLFLPFLDGERCPVWDPHVRGSLVGLHRRHGLAHLARSVLEGVGYGLRDCLEHLRGSGVEVTEACLTGGGLRSPVWRDIAVNILGTPGRVRRPSEPAVGAALLAARCLGHEITLQRDADALVPGNPEAMRDYDTKYRIRSDVREQAILMDALASRLR